MLTCTVMRDFGYRPKEQLLYLENPLIWLLLREFQIDKDYFIRSPLSYMIQNQELRKYIGLPKYKQSKESIKKNQQLKHQNSKSCKLPSWNQILKEPYHQDWRNICKMKIPLKVFQQLFSKYPQVPFFDFDNYTELISANRHLIHQPCCWHIYFFLYTKYGGGSIETYDLLWCELLFNARHSEDMFRKVWKIRDWSDTVTSIESICISPSDVLWWLEDNPQYVSKLEYVTYYDPSFHHLIDHLDWVYLS
ncbi:MAG: hypothetical protein EOP45_18455, partial [Sphingobacteriaceae bacterium]